MWDTVSSILPNRILSSPGSYVNESNVSRSRNRLELLNVDDNYSMWIRYYQPTEWPRWKYDFINVKTVKVNEAKWTFSEDGCFHLPKTDCCNKVYLLLRFHIVTPVFVIIDVIHMLLLKLNQLRSQTLHFHDFVTAYWNFNNALQFPHIRLQCDAYRTLDNNGSNGVGREENGHLYSDQQFSVLRRGYFIKFNFPLGILYYATALIERCSCSITNRLHVHDLPWRNLVITTWHTCYRL